MNEPTCSAPSISKVLAFGVVTGLKAEADLWGPTVLTASGAGPNAALAADLKAHLKARLAPYKYPRWIEFASELPKTATGKIQRFKLRA